MTEDHTWGGNAEATRRSFRGARKERCAGAELVSVIIPCYNQAHFLGEAIESVLAQSYPHVEVVVVDDGSTDDTAEVAGSYPGVRLVRQENRGLSGARNSGLALAAGEYVVFLDADDRLLPEALEVGVEQLRARPECAFVSGHHRRIAGDGSALGTSSQPHVEGDRYLALLRRCYIWPPAVVVYRRAIFESVGGFDTSVGAAADYDMYLRIARRFPVCSHEEMVAEYRQHGANMTRNPALMLSASVAVLHSQRKHIQGHKQYKKAYKAGVRWEQGGYGNRLVNKVRVHIKRRQWKRALGGMLVLLRYYPQGLALLLNERRLKRRKLARQLLISKQKLEAHERRHKGLENAQKSGSALEKERQEVQLLRERIQGLEQQMQNLEQRARMGRNGKVRKLLKRVWRDWYGDPLVSEVRVDLHEREWKQAIRDMLVLLRHYLRGLALLIRRPRLSQELQALEQQLRELKQRERRPPVGGVSFGDLRRLTPIGRNFGCSRGRPIDRYYIENFLARHADNIRGRVLEIGDDSYTRRYGGDRVKRSDVLDVTEGNPQATIVADLTRAEHVPSDTFDCILFTQTLQYIYNMRSAIQTLHRILKPGGVLLATFPGISQIGCRGCSDHWCWAFTQLSAQRLFEEAFPAANVTVEAHGNVLAATAFLHGLVMKELRQEELDYHDPDYEVLITLKAIKP